MSKLRDALKYLGTKVNGVAPNGYYITDVIKNFADDYERAHPTPQPTEQVTLTYALGEYADQHDEDKLPDPVTVNAGETVNVDFSTYPLPLDEEKEFVGWAVLDGQSVPDYSEDGTNTITMNDDVTLYPVYAEHVASDYLTIDNAKGSANILVEWYDEEKGTWKTSIEVIAGSSEDFEYEPERTYRISYGDGSFHYCVFTGVLGGDNYNNEDCTDGGNGVINAPDNHDWQFESGVHSLTVSQGS